MKAFEIGEFGIDNLALVERETPQVAPGHVLVKMTAASLNYRDLMVVKGQYNPKMKRLMALASWKRLGLM
jgi:NADPH:quinone reductase-like Zn-dependent oxidoreductase